ncbi:hypothetical protein SUDANB105_07767 [Streptomyces sp. enrichment culture]|uniref:hypothetical protein n=1 Tax=Streptomyces sp. enrichment culture TaxID=1795815 RepID=UPI003F55296A
MRREEEHASPDDAAALVNSVEGYLHVRAHQEDARREAEELCARMPWLTSAQAEDVTRHYVRQRMLLTRRILQTTADRAVELRSEYEARYATLRRELLKRHTACACAVLAGASAVAVLTGVLVR